MGEGDKGSAVYLTGGEVLIVAAAPDTVAQALTAACPYTNPPTPRCPGLLSALVGAACGWAERTSLDERGGVDALRVALASVLAEQLGDTVAGRLLGIEEGA